MTARQAGELGGHVHRDARPAMSIYASSFREGGAPGLLGEKASGLLIRFLRHHWVYNADEVEGLPRYYYARDVPPTPALLSHRQEAIDAFFAAKGEEISLNGFGKFKVKDSPEREGRNPATGEAMTFKASKKLTFAPAKAVKDKLNG